MVLSENLPTRDELQADLDKVISCGSAVNCDLRNMLSQHYPESLDVKSVNDSWPGMVEYHFETEGIPLVASVYLMDARCASVLIVHYLGKCLFEYETVMGYLLKSRAMGSVSPIVTLNDNAFDIYLYSRRVTLPADHKGILAQVSHMVAQCKEVECLLNWWFPYRMQRSDVEYVSLQCEGDADNALQAVFDLDQEELNQLRPCSSLARMPEVLSIVKANLWFGRYKEVIRWHRYLSRKKKSVEDAKIILEAIKPDVALAHYCEGNWEDYLALTVGQESETGWNSPARTAMALCQIGGKECDALQLLDNIREGFATDPAIHFVRALCYARCEQIDEFQRAAQHYEELSGCDPIATNMWMEALPDGDQ
jgi:hypothetical protein